MVSHKETFSNHHFLGGVLNCRFFVSYRNHGLLSEVYGSAHELANEIEVAIGVRKPSQKPGPEDDMSKEVELMMDKYFLATKKKSSWLL